MAICSNDAPGQADQIVSNRNNHFRHDRQAALHQQIERSMHGAGEAVLDRRERVVGDAVANGGEHGLESGARNKPDLFAEEFDDSLFAERSALTLKSHARVGLNVHTAASFRRLEPRRPPLVCPTIP